MSATTLRDSQLAMARYLRNPSQEPAPAGLEARRLQIYQRLVYNNIEGFISGGFPVLRSLYVDAEWHELVRGFVHRHRCKTPYFLEISQEFIQFLLHEYSPRECDPPFMAELAHYEWVELALDVAEELPPAAVTVPDVLPVIPRLSPVAWVLQYRFAVHRIGPAYRPAEPGDPTYLAVYRDRHERVRFMELNAASARLLELVRENSSTDCAGLLRQLAGELELPEDTVLSFGAGELVNMIDLGVVAVAG